jgi:hypothetical protein
MKYNLLGAVASIAFIATGAVAVAQDNQKQEQRPAAERTEPKAPAMAPKAQGEQPGRAAQTEQRDEQKTGPAMKEEPKGARNEMKEQPKGAQNEMKEQPKGAQNEMKEQPKAAEGSNRRDEERKTAEPNGARTPSERTGQNHEERNTRTAERPEQGGAPRVTGKVHLSTEKAQRVTEVLRRGGHSENVNIAINVGERIPGNVVVYPLPEEVISIAPEYRGYDYFVDNDEIVFVAPESHEIVGSIEYEGRAAATEGGPTLAAARPCPTEQ